MKPENLATDEHRFPQIMKTLFSTALIRVSSVLIRGQNSGRRLLALAFNHAADRCIAIGLATNITSILGPEEWQPLADYSTTDYWREENGKWKKYQQVLARPQAEKMVAAINRQKAKQGTHFRGLPIYRGHPDADPKQWPDDARYGGVTDLEARADGLYAKLAWNDLGAKNKEQGYYIYPSPAWLFDESDAQSRGIIAPDVLQSVGLTNTPRIPSSKPWTNTDPTGSQFAANNPPSTVRCGKCQREFDYSAQPETAMGAVACPQCHASLDQNGNLLSPAGEAQKNDNQKQKEDMHKKQLLKLLGLPDDATDEQINAAHEKLIAHNSAVTAAAAKAAEELKTLATNVTTVTGERDSAKSLAENARTETEKFRKLAINSALDRAIDTGRITAAERAGFETKLGTDFDATLTELNAKKTALNTKPLDPLKPTDGPDLGTPRGRQLAFNVRMDEIQALARSQGKPISIDDAINQMRANAADAALLKSMEPTPAQK